MFNIVLVAPEIPPNTGNIGRLCHAAGFHLHLIEPLGFSLDEKSLRRAGLDYWSELAAIYPDSRLGRSGRYWTARAHETLGPDQPSLRLANLMALGHNLYFECLGGNQYMIRARGSTLWCQIGFWQNRVVEIESGLVAALLRAK